MGARFTTDRRAAAAGGVAAMVTAAVAAGLLFAADVHAAASPGAQPPLAVRAAHAWVTWLLPALWFGLGLATAALCVAALRRRGHAPPSAAATTGGGTSIWRPLWALSALGLGLRVAFAPWGPGDQRATLTAAYDGWGATADLGRYGRAIEALIAVVFTWTGPTDTVPLVLSFACGVAAPPLLTLAARGLGAPRRVALLAGLGLALAPLHVRLSGTVNRYVPALTLLLLAGAAWPWVRGLRQPKGAALGRRAAWWVLALAVPLALQCRPDALVALPLLGLGLVWTRQTLAQRTIRARPSQVRAAQGRLDALAAVWLALLLWPALHVAQLALSQPDWVMFVDPARSVAGGRWPMLPRYNAALHPDYTPVVWIALTLVGAALGVRSPARRRRTLVWLTWGLGLAAASATHEVSGDPLSARYHVLALPGWLLLAAEGGDALLAAGVARWPTRRRALTATLAAALCLGAAWPMVPHTRRTTLDAEVAFLRAHLAAVPDGCTIVAFHPHSRDLALRPGRTLSASAGRSHRWVGAWDPFTAGPCVALYQGSSCAALREDPQLNTERRHPCEELPAVARPWADAALPNRPAGNHKFGPGPVRVQLAWLRR